MWSRCCRIVKARWAARRRTTGICEVVAVGDSLRHTLGGPPGALRQVQELHKRFIRWAEAGVLDRLFDDLVADRKNPDLMLDSTIVRVHQQAATGREKGAKTRL